MLRNALFKSKTALLLAGALSGCVVGPTPENASGSAWMAQQAPAQSAVCLPVNRPSAGTADHVSLAAIGNGASRLAPGDRVRLSVLGDEDVLSGVYVIDADGMISIPGIAPVPAAGMAERAVAGALAQSLIAADLVRPLSRAVDLRLIESSGVSVAVTGAVFQAGTVRVGERRGEDRVGQREGEASGDANASRTITTALRAAGGVRPDADIAHVELVRGDRRAVIDLSGAVSGSDAADIGLTAGDRLIVHSTGCFNPDLVRPTPVTAPGIRVYMSNLSRPANNNAGAAIGAETTSLPYGTRMLQGLVAMNCIGGSAMNARRRAVLISRNPMNGQSVVIEREVEKLVREADRDTSDPYLMPGDALACYDSRMMNFADAVSLVSGAVNTVTPALILSGAAN